MIIKPVSVAVDLDSAASNVSTATLVSILNTNSGACLIVNSNGNNFYIGAGECKSEV